MTDQELTADTVTGSATRYTCPMPDCGWTRDVLPTEGPMGAEVALREHANSHSVLEYTRALVGAQTERDQYASASRHYAWRIRQTAYVWTTTLPETIRTAEVVKALNGVASHVPDRPELRDDLWMRIAGAYEARFENDGHPEDARHAADEAMSVVQPVVDELRNRAEVAEKRLEALTEATVLWRDRPGGDVGLAIALAGILDTEQPEPPAATALVRVLRECDRIEREVFGQHNENDDGMREAVRRIRDAAGSVPPAPETV